LNLEPPLADTTAETQSSVKYFDIKRQYFATRNAFSKTNTYFLGTAPGKRIPLLT
jgi:hypothetical protein